MMAYLIHADGTFEGVETSGGHFLQHGDRWFRSAGVARDKNTTVDGLLLEGAPGPSNEGVVVYLEVPEPPFATVRAVLV